jgi:hypothetical protein
MTLPTRPITRFVLGVTLASSVLGTSCDSSCPPGTVKMDSLCRRENVDAGAAGTGIGQTANGETAAAGTNVPSPAGANARVPSAGSGASNLASSGAAGVMVQIAGSGSGGGIALPSPSAGSSAITAGASGSAATANEPCGEEGQYRCAAAGAGQREQCTAGRWVPTAACSANQGCMNSSGACLAPDAACTGSGCKPTCGNDITEAPEICDGNCPSSCDDGDACTKDASSGSGQTCDFACTHAAISSATCLCGNGRLDPGEECDDTSATRCPANCDDGDVCTKDTSAGSAATCDLKCSATPLMTATCLCGNGMLDSGESCDDSSSKRCPASCEDSDPCTDNPASGSAATCNLTCGPVVPSTTPECLCGNGVLDPGETCDDTTLTGCGCNDLNSCTSDTVLSGAASQCNLKCSHLPITTGSCAPTSSKFSPCPTAGCNACNKQNFCTPNCTTDADCSTGTANETAMCDTREGFGYCTYGCGGTGDTAAGVCPKPLTCMTFICAL